MTAEAMAKHCVDQAECVRAEILELVADGTYYLITTVISA